MQLGELNVNRKSILTDCASVCATLCRVIANAERWGDIEAAHDAMRHAMLMANQMHAEQSMIAGQGAMSGQGQTAAVGGPK